MEINCIEYTLWKYFSGVWRPFLRKATPWQHTTSCGRNTVHNTGLGHVIARPTHRPTSYTWRVASLTNKTCTGSLLVNFVVLEKFDHWWLTDWMDMNGEIVLSAQCLQHYVNRTSVTCAVTAELHVSLGYNNKVGCVHGSRTWQLTQQAACPSFARNHWLE